MLNSRTICFKITWLYLRGFVLENLSKALSAASRWDRWWRIEQWYIKIYEIIARTIFFFWSAGSSSLDVRFHRYDLALFSKRSFKSTTTKAARSIHGWAPYSVGLLFPGTPVPMSYCGAVEKSSLEQKQWNVKRSKKKKKNPVQNTKIQVRVIFNKTYGNIHENVKFRESTQKFIPFS